MVLGAPREHRDVGVGLAARRGGDRRPHPPAPFDDRVRQLPAPGRTAHRPPQRDLRRETGHRRPRADRAGRHDGPGGLVGGGGRDPGQGPPRFGLERAAGASRRRAEVRRPALRRRHEQPRARYRHGVGRPRDPGRGTAERGIRSPARRTCGAPGRRGEPRRPVPEAPQRCPAHRRRHRADAVGAHRGHLGAAEPARHPRAADRRGLGAGSHRRRGVVRDGQAQCAVPFAPPLGVRSDAGSARRALPVRRVRRAAPAPGVGSRRGHAHRPSGRTAGRRDQRRHDPRPRIVRGVRRGRVAERPRRRARRRDGLRVARQRRLHPRHDELAHRRDHARPRQRRAGLRAARQAAVLARRRHRPARRTRRGTGQVLARSGRRRTRQGRGATARVGSRRQRDHQPARLPRRAARSHRHPPHRPHADGRAQPRRGGRLAHHPAFPVRHAGALPVGTGRQRAYPRTSRRRGGGGRQ
ncbi:hypothetical protein SRABI128_03246 [Microbacterium sp. Bi128]|nr:hypothetical protein SRABI128_03246 [Microbacterium sp. Bi128]